MRLANGDGSVYKLSGKRRKPWVARVTVGWDLDENKALQKRKVIGTYASKLEALSALADFKKNPYNLDEGITFAELYDKWSAVHFQKVSRSNVNGCRASFKLCDQIKGMKVRDIKLSHLQGVVDDSGKNTPTLRKLKVLFGLMYDYAVRNEIVGPDKRDMVKFVDISGAGNPNAYDRRPFTKAEISTLWTNASDEYVGVILMLIYSGCRISELLELKKEDVHLDERYFYIGRAKTQAGIREVPIAEKVAPFFQSWLAKPCDFLLCTPDFQPLTYRNYYDAYWTPLVSQLGMSDLTPHCTRHTCISLLVEAGVDDRIIKQIVGHKGQTVTQVVYTHVDLPAKLTAINSI